MAYRYRVPGTKILSSVFDGGWIENLADDQFTSPSQLLRLQDTTAASSNLTLADQLEVSVDEMLPVSIVAEWLCASPLPGREMRKLQQEFASLLLGF